MAVTAPSRIALAVLTALATIAPIVGRAQPTPDPAAIDGFDSATPEDVSRLLRAARDQYGDDAVTLQAALLVNAMRNGSVLATGVRIDGFKEYQGKRYLGFQVDTGMIFDDITRDQLVRLHILWGSVMEPTLARLTDGLQVAADGISVALRYHHRPYASAADLRATIDHPGSAEEAAFFLLADDVNDLTLKTVTPHALVGRARIVVDGHERGVPPLEHEPPNTPGPD